MLRHARARTAIVLLGAGLIAASSTAGSASAATTGPGGLPPGCVWTIHRQPMPAGYVDFNMTQGDGVSSFVGDATGPDGLDHALLWKDGAVTVLSSPGGGSAAALDVNVHGVVLAVAQRAQSRPFLWINGRIVFLAVPAGGSATVGYSINDAGTVVGTSIIGGAVHGIVWSANSPKSYRDLGVSDGGLALTGINDAGVIVGDATTDTSYRAVTGTVTSGLSSLPGVDPTQNSTAIAIAGRDIVGTGQVPGAAADQNYVLWQGNVATALPSMFSALAVNRHGLVAGYLNDGTPNITVWANGTTWSLPRLSNIPLSGDGAAYQVLEDGTVVGTRSDDNYNNVPVTWTCG